MSTSITYAYPFAISTWCSVDNAYANVPGRGRVYTDRAKVFIGAWLRVFAETELNLKQSWDKLESRDLFCFEYTFVLNQRNYRNTINAKQMPLELKQRDLSNLFKLMEDTFFKHLDSKYGVAQDDKNVIHILATKRETVQFQDMILLTVSTVPEPPLVEDDAVFMNRWRGIFIEDSGKIPKEEALLFRDPRKAQTSKRPNRKLKQ